MSETEFQQNDELSKIIQERLGDYIDVGQKLGEGMYSVSSMAQIDGATGGEQILRLFKYYGPTDKLETKRENIEREIEYLAALETAGVAEKIREVTGVSLRRILETGPYAETADKEDGFVFWDDNPIKYGGNEFVAYQINELIPGVALADVHAARSDADFVKKAGEHFGRTLAEFHFNARDIALPHYQLAPDLNRKDHAFRMVRNAKSNAEAMAKTDHEFQPFHDLAARIYSELVETDTEGNVISFKPNDGPVISIHGDLNPGNITVDEKTGLITGLLDFDKGRKGPAEYDFMGVAVIPGMLDAALNAYQQRMHELGGDITIDKALALKLALAVRIGMATWPEESIHKLTFNTVDSNEKIRARGIAAVGNIVEQLAQVDPAYIGLASAVRPKIEAANDQFKGISLEAA